MVFIAEAGPAAGAGHLVRCSRIAREAMRRGWTAALILAAEGATVDAPADLPSVSCVAEVTAPTVATALEERAADVVVLDVRPSARAPLATLARAWPRPTWVHVAHERPAPPCFEDLIVVAGPTKLEAQSYTRPDWSTGRLVSGPEYLVLGAVGEPPPRAFGATDRRVLVTMGASDPGGLTELAVDALDRIDADLEVTVLFGRFMDSDRRARLRPRIDREGWRVLEDVADARKPMGATDLAVINGGLTRYEVAALGTPMVTVSLDDVQCRLNEHMATLGAGVHAGRKQEVTAAGLARIVRELLADPDRRGSISRRQRGLFAGHGEAQIVDLLRQVHAERTCHELE